jgi:hypothetical protein
VASDCFTTEAPDVGLALLALRKMGDETGGKRALGGFATAIVL